MSSFQQILIGGYPSGGLTTDVKPLMLADEAYSTLENAYVWRNRTKKREGTVSMGRLTRVFSNVSIGNSGASPWTFNIYTASGTVPTANELPEIQPGSVRITIATIADPFIDQGDGTFTNLTPGNSGIINYLTGDITLTQTAGAGHASTATFGYYPTLPVMGICKRDIASVGIDETIFFDRVYAYQYVNGFQELAPGTTWTGSNTDFFWSCNYQGATSDLRYFFETNNNLNKNLATYDPIRYYNNSAWVDFQPLLTSTTRLFQGLIILPYYGRLIVLNTWEGPEGGTFNGASNFFTRCRFSQLGDPTDQVDGWRSDEYGRGGYVDAPTNESIVSAAFFRNTLVVFFEYSTWQLRYIGEYGLPFIFERISSDFGSVSTYSPIIFDQGVMTVSDRGVIQASASGIQRLDEQIPDEIFSFQIQNNSPNFVHGVRDFRKEVVYWNYKDESNLTEFQSYPNKVLLFNYKNNTWAKFRDTITCFGLTQYQFGVTWDSLTVTWDDFEVSWDDTDDENFTEYVTAGNQQGFISIYENGAASTLVESFIQYGPTLTLTAVDFTQHPNLFTSASHNLGNLELIYLTNTQWVGTNPGLNNKIYQAQVQSADTFTLGEWNEEGKNYVSVDKISSATYIGGGLISLLPKMNIIGKDFNPFQAQGQQFKLSYIDFQMDSNLTWPAIPAVSIQLFVNSRINDQANVITGNQELENSSQMYGIITGASKANPCLIKSPGHSLTTGQTVYINNVQGMINLNNLPYTITVVDADNFSLNGIDSSGFPAYTSGGVYNTFPVEGQSYVAGSQYTWYRFYSTQFGQYLRIAITYDDTLMNQLSTHQLPMELNAMSVWVKQGGRLVN